MGAVEVRFYGAINDLLPRALRQRGLARPYEPHQTVIDLIEACNVPHTEVGLIVVDGDVVDPDARVADGQRVAVYPPLRLLAQPPAEPSSFVVDVHLGALARLLRLLGFDAWYRNDAGDDELAALAAEGPRSLLTRDIGLLKRRIVTHGYLVRSNRPVRQALEVIGRYDLADRARPFTRCLRCGGELAPVAKAEVVDRIESGTRQSYDEFATCRRCEQVYWAGAHHQRLQATVDALLTLTRRRG